MDKNGYQGWTEFYAAFADALLPFRDNRVEVVAKIKAAFRQTAMKLPTLEKDGNLVDIDPFTIFGLFNKGITHKNRMDIIKALVREFGVSAAIPEQFDGVPILNNQRSTFYWFIDARGEHDIDNLWGVFNAALEYARTHSAESKAEFIEYYDRCLKQKGIKWNLSMGLYWVRPYDFLSLDFCNRTFFAKPDQVPAAFVEMFGKMKDNDVPTGARYLGMVETCKQVLETGGREYSNFPELSFVAWLDLNQEPDLEAREDEAGIPVFPTARPVEDGAYTAQDFLAEVFMDKTQYERIVRALKKKKNIILQGAPGVGKTFMATRLAYSLMGCRDVSRVQTVQFHQSYSYEDFIEGFRPVENGFQLRKGAFLEFCDQARADAGRDYFFIIDEINRGHLSKIFGELFMLLESDKRQPSDSVKLLYSGGPFSIPANLYIIGMMNTADRGLAMVDYALRRRFSFVDIHPGFETEGFKRYQAGLGSPAFDRLVETVKRLNAELAEDDALGNGHCIGHSFFCGLTAETASAADLADIVELELIPLLREYWFDERTKCGEWGGKLRESVR